jgi:hypothetical protein
MNLLYRIASSGTRCSSNDQERRIQATAGGPRFPESDPETSRAEREGQEPCLTKESVWGASGCDRCDSTVDSRRHDIGNKLLPFRQSGEIGGRWNWSCQRRPQASAQSRYSKRQKHRWSPFFDYTAARATTGHCSLSHSLFDELYYIPGLAIVFGKDCVRVREELKLHVLKSILLNDDISSFIKRFNLVKQGLSLALYRAVRTTMKKKYNRYLTRRSCRWHLSQVD